MVPRSPSLSSDHGLPLASPQMVVYIWSLVKHHLWQREWPQLWEMLYLIKPAADMNILCLRPKCDSCHVSMETIVKKNVS
jgi:hypothetical protein